MCYHNPECSFEARHPSGASYYAGADIHYRGEDQNGRQALLWKWSADLTPGPRACIGGACYAFPLEWYEQAGRPLAALPAWGCDEEALSISAWLAGYQPAVYPVRVAHRWRERPPWHNKSPKARPLWESRAAMIAAVLADPRDRAELLTRQDCRTLESPAIDRWRDALLRLPRTWAEWRAAVPSVDLGKTPTAPAGKRPFVEPTITTMPRANYGSNEDRRACPRCHGTESEVTSTRKAGRMVIRYRRCLACGTRRVTQQILP